MAVLSFGYIFIEFLVPSEQTSFFDYDIPEENRLQINVLFNKLAH
jgi:hypothetical protein